MKYYFQFGFRKNGQAAHPSDIPTIKILNVKTGAVVVNGADVTKEPNMTGLSTYVHTTETTGLLLTGLAHSTDATLEAQDIFYFCDLSSQAAT
jgi:hypothetical protein